jgi:pimeloyl-ACP methyl ester carboxylesterase
LYGRLDLDEIGAMGHSQGAAATAVAASDPRIKSLILWNGGTSNEKPFLNVSGERDIGEPDPAGMATRTDAATQPGAWVYHRQVLQTGGRFTGHLVLMEQPERVWDLSVAWWDCQLKDQAESKAMFVGDGCGLCNRATEFEYGHNALLR